MLNEKIFTKEINRRVVHETTNGFHYLTWLEFINDTKSTYFQIKSRLIVCWERRCCHLYLSLVMKVVPVQSFCFNCHDGTE